MISANKPEHRPLSERIIDDDQLRYDLMQVRERIEDLKRTRMEIRRRQVLQQNKIADFTDWLDVSQLKDVRRSASELLSMAGRQIQVSSEELEQIEASIAQEERSFAMLESRVKDTEAQLKPSEVLLVTSITPPLSWKLDKTLVEKVDEPSTEQLEEEEEEEEEEIEERHAGHDDALSTDVYRYMLSCPEAVCLSGEGSIIVLDSAKSSVFKVSSSDKVEILAGIGMSGYSDGSTSQGSSKHDAPDHVPAAFSHPRGMSIDESGNIFVCDTGNHCIRGISVHGRITTMAGTAQSPGSADGPALSSSFNQPWCCVSGRFHEEDCLYICDSGNDSIRCLHADEGGAMVKTIVGSTSQQHNRNKLKFPWSIAYVDNLLYVGDKYNYRLVELSPEKGEILRSISDLWPSSLRFAPRGIAISDDGNMYLTDSWNCKVWRWKVDGTEALQEVAGSGIRSHRDGRGEFAQFLYPSGIAVESASSVVVCDTGNQCLRRCKMLRDDEVKEKMKKLVQSINTRNIRQAIITWAVASQTDSTTWQPFDVVLSLALGSIGSDSSECPLKVFEDRSPDLRAMVETIARVLQWRVVKSRSQAEFENSLEMSDEERRAKIVEAKQIFDTYDQDGGGSIDAQELKEALAAADVEMSEEEVASLLEEYDEDGSGTISFEEFCQMQGLSLTDTEREEFLPSSSDDATGVDSDHSELPDTAAQSRNRQEEIAPSEENSEKQGAEQKAAGSRKSSEQRVDENKSKKSVPAADQVKSAVADSSRTSKPSAASSDKLASQTQTRKK